MFGYMGNILRINLNDHQFKSEKIENDMVNNFIGGRGFGIKILFEEIKPATDPLGPENKLVFAAGPVTGTPIVGNTKHIVMAKSPLTGIWGESHASGSFGPKMKYAGYDAIILEGKSEKPIYIHIDDGNIDFISADKLWGESTGETLREIKKKNGEVSVASIGPAGERLVKYASIVHDGHFTAGRCGMGAVMGSKNLKALAIKGSNKVEIADPDKFKDSKEKNVKAYFSGGDTKEKDKIWVGRFGDYGTSLDVLPLNESGRLPTRNFNSGYFKDAEDISGEKMADTIRIDRMTCFACPAKCNQIVKAEKPYSVDPLYGGPEYEILTGFGSNLMNNNLVAVAKANELCNKYGIDTLSTSGCIAFAMECYENGLIDKNDVDGLDLKWGNHEAIIKLTEKIGKREGFGRLLGEGVKRASAEIGKESEKFAIHVKGMEVPMHEPRGKPGVGLAYAISNRGACHLQTVHDDMFEIENVAPEIGLAKPVDRYSKDREKVKRVILGENYLAVCDSALICMHLYWISSYYTPSNLFEIIKAVTGMNVSYDELMKIGERTFNLVRMFNIREGITRKDDVLPERFSEPLPDGPTKGLSISKEELEKMLDNYYEYRKWNQETGIPTKEKLLELNLDAVNGINDLLR